ncbi:MAG: DUF4139 domain-containing protein [Acidobacteriota bacterium]|jgi:hypothetical protein|nr:DUF4139 domain-containing protein [Acidobacteriota bacterium]
MFVCRWKIVQSLTLALCLAPLGAAAQDAVPLPVRNVELYKNGMGFFEHLGRVKGSQDVEIALPGSQLNDVLKSLTVLDLGDGQVAGVTYDSAAPLDRRLEEFPVDLSSSAGIAQFLNQIRGAGVEIKTPSGAVAGKLLGAEDKSRATASGGTAVETFVNVLGAAGEVHSVRLESAGALKLTDPELAGDLGRALDVLSGSHRRDVRKLRIQAAGSGDRQLYIGYTSEAPIWKTTYRVVLDPGTKPLLQGWAIVDNTTPMDWNDVSLALVAGAPISFIQKLSQPIYASRPEVPVAQGVQAAPQTSEAVMETQFAAPAAAAPPPAPQPLRRAEFITRDAAGTGAAVNDALRKSQAAAQGSVVGEQFEYRLKQPVTVKRNESALLPILQTDIDGEKVAVYNASGGESHPRLAFRIKNSSGMTLDAGAVTVIDSNAFAGEGLIETVQPGESRLMGYAVDQGTSVAQDVNYMPQGVQQVVIQSGTLRMRSKGVYSTAYKIRNNNDATRSVIVEHPVRAGYTLTPATPVPEETTASYRRFRVEVKPKATVDLKVEEESPRDETFAVSSVSPDQIAVWVRNRSIDGETEALLREVASRQAAINELVRKTVMLDGERDGIFKDQERVRENLQGLGQSPDEASLRQRYVRQLDSQENRIAAIRAEMEKLESDCAAAQKQLEAFIQKISVDKKL